MQYSRILDNIYHLLYNEFGPQYWWPGETPVEISIGAILTQNTNWENVEKAIRNLKTKNILNIKKLHKTSSSELAKLIKPSGYYNIKTKRLKAFVNFVMDTYGGNIKHMRDEDTLNLRNTLLSISGIGPETADSILLYALNKPVFVIDAYTKRVLSRHNIMDHSRSYDEFQEFFHKHLEINTQLFNVYHALFVKVGKLFCRKKPLCNGTTPCPLSIIK